MNEHHGHPEYSLLSKIVAFLTIIGAINWGLVGLFDFNLVEALFPAALERAVYILVGLSGLTLLFTYLVPALRMHPQDRHHLAPH